MKFNAELPSGNVVLFISFRVDVDVAVVRLPFGVFFPSLHVDDKGNRKKFALCGRFSSIILSIFR